MRVTGGDLKGRTIAFPAGCKDRPTSDFLRETLFNLLGSVAGKTFLDLFAGTGSVGIEAASRRAAAVLMVEKNKKLTIIAERNIRSLALDSVCRIIQAGVEKSLKDLWEKGYHADVIFADPPYHKKMVEMTLKGLSRYPLLAPEGILVLQHSVKENYDAQTAGHWFQVAQKRYGENALTFFRGE